MKNIFNKAYYTFKPLIPRDVQVYVRSLVVRQQAKRHSDTWPIDHRAACQPEGWRGWPSEKRFALVLTHDVDTRKGHDNCRKLMGLEKKMEFRSSFYFVAKRYDVCGELREHLQKSGFGVGIHGLYHDGKKFNSLRTFQNRAREINEFMREWGVDGFSSPSMLRNLEWFHELNILYDLSTFDTDPFEPQPQGVQTIFPFLVRSSNGRSSYVELPYTLPQDFTLFVLMKEKNIDIWKRKLDWIAENGGMARINVHPDYMRFESNGNSSHEYPARLYEEFLDYIRTRYRGQYWNALPREVAQYCTENPGENTAQQETLQTTSEKE